MCDTVEMSTRAVRNVAFIDGQNLHLGTRVNGWTIDHAKFRIYLRDKYHIDEAYYFLGFVSEEEQDLYNNLQRAGFILSFREHSSTLKGQKKGNVDSDIVFSAMRMVADGELFEKIFIISGDGDYKKLVDYLVKKQRFGKMLFPNTQFASSLYRQLGGDSFAYLDDRDVRSKIAHHQK